MGDSEAKAKLWEEKAQKKLKGWFGGSGKYEEAAEMYEKAANLWKISKKWDEAGRAFGEASDCFFKHGSNHEAATHLVNAANCYKRTNIGEATNKLRAAIELYTEEGRFSIAAKQQKEIAELFESEMDYEQAIEAYSTAADLFDGENSTSSANQCLLKVALYSAQLERYGKAIEIYEKVAAKAVDNNLLKYSCKDYFMRAALCYLAQGDTVGAEKAIERYNDMDVSFSQTREGKFIEEIVASVRDVNVEDFTNAVVEFDSISKLDSWKTSILLKIKQAVKQEDGGGEDDLL